MENSCNLFADLIFRQCLSYYSPKVAVIFVSVGGWKDEEVVSEKNQAWKNW